MAAKIKYFRCTNRSKCDLARNREKIEIGDGKRFICPVSDPNCERTHLREIDPPGAKISPKLIIVAAALLVIAIIAVFAWPKGPSNGVNGKIVESALQEVWPWLK